MFTDRQTSTFSLLTGVPTDLLDVYYYNSLYLLQPSAFSIGRVFFGLKSLTPVQKEHKCTFLCVFFDLDHNSVMATLGHVMSDSGLGWQSFCQSDDLVCAH